MTTVKGFDADLSWANDYDPGDAQDDLDTFLKLADTHTLRVVQNTKEEVVEVARRYVPVHTGKLRDSISGTVRVEGRGLVLLVGSPVEYAYYVEHGTSSQSAQPYLRPALEEVGPKFDGALKKAILMAAKGV